MEAIQFIQIDPDAFKELISTSIRQALEDFKKEFEAKTEDEDLLNREQVLELLQIDASTLWRWQNDGRIIVHKFANKCYYKRSEVMAGLVTKQ